MRALILLASAALVLAACGQRDPNRIAFDGVFYRADAKAPRNDRKNFVATVRPVSEGLEGARAAGGYEGIQHCITYYGTSDIAWTVGPDTPPEALSVENDTLTFEGTCVE